MKCAVLGSPIAHSLSPTLHRAAYQALGLTDWEYESYEVQADALEAFLKSLDEQWRGLSLTMPLKRKAFELAAQATPIAVAVGVANTLVRCDDGWLAANTDVGGMADALRPSWQGYRQVAMLGAGATATSALFALQTLGVTEILVYSRNRAKAEPLIQTGSALNINIMLRDLETWPKTPAPVLISTLPAGAVTEGQLSQVTSWPQVVFDVVYANWPTPLAQAAMRAEVRLVPGLDMLVFQAVRQFELFTGQPAPVQEMFEAGSQR